MRSTLSKPMTEHEKDELLDMLSELPHENAMNLEEVDGFFAALHACPDIISFNNYLPEIWGDDTGEMEAPFENTEELNAFLQLLLRYWNDVGQRFKEEVYIPCILSDDKTGIYNGNDWADGFLKGMDIAGGFNEMLDDEEQSGWFVPIFMLAYEHDEDPEMRPYQEEMTTEQREKIIISLCAGVTQIFRYYASHRINYARASKEQNTIRNNEPKPGRNDPCFCGSGKKYKKCCL